MSVLPDRQPISDIHRDFTAAVTAGDWARAFDLDIDFHGAITAAVGSPRASAWLEGLLKDLRLAHLVAPSFNGEAFLASVAQHGEIVAAIGAGDTVGARVAMKRHLDAAESALIADMGRARS
jgi:DNA-binding GntR family transcriptional regulator